MESDSFKNLKNRINRYYKIDDYRHAFTILENDFPNEFKDVLNLIINFRIKKKWIVEGGGGKTRIAKNIEMHFNKKGWREQKFVVSNKINGKETTSETNKIDCFKNKIGLEIQWNNKTEFYAYMI